MRTTATAAIATFADTNLLGNDRAVAGAAAIRRPALADALRRSRDVAAAAADRCLPDPT
jgi:hypothetical protein